jgi:hypothetical protein
MTAIRPFDLETLRAQGLETIVVDLAAGTLELRFAHYVQIWQRVPAPSLAAQKGGYLRAFNGELYVGPKETP